MLITDTELLTHSDVLEPVAKFVVRSQSDSDFMSFFASAQPLHVCITISDIIVNLFGHI